MLAFTFPSPTMARRRSRSSDWRRRVILVQVMGRGAGMWASYGGGGRMKRPVWKEISRAARRRPRRERIMPSPLEWRRS